MDIPPRGMGTSSRAPVAAKKSRRGRVGVVFCCPCKVIQWLARGVLRHKIYVLCMILIVILFVCIASLIGSAFLEELNFLPPSCVAENNAILDSIDEIWKADSAVATTMMTLLPALLIFAPFRTARIGSLIVFSTSAALLTAGFTLGLATSNVVTLPKSKIFKVSDLCSEITTTKFAAVQDLEPEIAELYLPKQPLVTSPSNGSRRLQTPTDNPLRDIMLKAENEHKRPTRIKMSVKKIGFFLTQVMLLYTLLALITRMVDIEIFWVCNGWSFNLLLWWIGVSALLTGIIRTVAESSRFSKVQILHLRPLSRSFVFEPCQNCLSSHVPSKQSTSRQWYDIRQTVSEYLQCILSLPRRHWTGQKSHHGMVVVLRPSGNVDRDYLNIKHLLLSVCRGLFQALMLIIMTAIFGSTYRNTVLEATVFLSCFIGLVVPSRTYSVYFCALMEHTTDAVQIEYDTPAELAAIHRVLLGMPSMFIYNTTLQHKYASGNNVAPAPGCTNHMSSMAKQVPQIIVLTTTMVCRLVASRITILIYYLYRRHSSLLVLVWGFTIAGILFLMTKKLYSDFAFLDTFEDADGAGHLMSGIV